MGLTLKEVESILESASKLGVSEFQFEGLKVKYKVKSDIIALPEVKIPIEDKFKVNQPFTLNDAVPMNEMNNELLKNYDSMTDEELKYYATPYYDELQAIKESELAKKTLQQGLEP